MRALVELENSGLVVLLEQDHYEDLARMYSLFRRIDEGLNLVRKIIRDHLKVTGSALVQDPESIKDPVDFVQRLLAMKEKYDRSVLPADNAMRHWLICAWHGGSDWNVGTCMLPEYTAGCEDLTLLTWCNPKVTLAYHVIVKSYAWSKLPPHGVVNAHVSPVAVLIVNLA